MEFEFEFLFQPGLKFTFKLEFEFEVDFEFKSELTFEAARSSGSSHSPLHRLNSPRSCQASTKLP